jgi:hypothetical protein
MKLKLSTIRINGGTQTRALINENVVAQYTEDLLGNAVFPPVIVFDDGLNKWLVDGFHRFFAHQRAGLTDILVDVRPGTQRDAQLFALGVNDKHGLQRTNADKRKAVQIVLEDIEWQDFSDSKIAKICNVSVAFVAKCRKEFGKEATGDKKYINKHGKVATMDTKNIGKKTEVATPREKPAVEPVTELAPAERYTPTDDDQIAELASVNTELNEENIKLKDQMVALSDDQEKINEQFQQLRAQVKGLEAELVAVKNSRDQFQSKNADLIKQVNYWRKRAEKAEKSTS